MVLAILKGLAVIVPMLSIKSLFDESLIVSVPDALQQWRDADPLCCKDKVRLAYIIEALKRCKELKSTLVRTLDILMFVMCGTKDRVVTGSGHELVVNASPNQDGIQALCRWTPQPPAGAGAQVMSGGS